MFFSILKYVLNKHRQNVLVMWPLMLLSMQIRLQSVVHNTIFRKYCLQFDRNHSWIVGKFSLNIFHMTVSPCDLNVSKSPFHEYCDA